MKDRPMLYVMLRWIRCLRTLAPVLLLTIALAIGAARADLNRLETVAIRLSGQVLDHGYVRAVFFAPLGLLWILQP